MADHSSGCCSAMRPPARSAATPYLRAPLLLCRNANLIVLRLISEDRVSVAVVMLVRRDARQRGALVGGWSEPVRPRARGCAAPSPAAATAIDSGCHPARDGGQVRNSRFPLGDVRRTPGCHLFRSAGFRQPSKVGSSFGRSALRASQASYASIRLTTSAGSPSIGTRRVSRLLHGGAIARQLAGFLPAPAGLV